MAACTFDDGVGRKSCAAIGLERVEASALRWPGQAAISAMRDRSARHAVLPELAAALAGRGMAVLQAPPGAGKTTVVPLDLLARGVVAGRILMLEPRRLAARAAAERMAETLGEPVGKTVGYRIRGEAKVSAATRIEVVTEGILTRMIQSDPELGGHRAGDLRRIPRTQPERRSWPGAVP